jgi:hypothetical protein
MQTTLAIDEDDRLCLLLDLDLALDCGREGGSEFVALMAGNWANGNIFPPGLADRERRGQAIFFSSLGPPQYGDDEQNVLLSIKSSLSLRHAKLGVGLQRALGLRKGIGTRALDKENRDCEGRRSGPSR